MKNPLAALRHMWTASSRAARADTYPHQTVLGVGQDWAPTTYGDYYAKSTLIYGAINIRATTLSLAPLRVVLPGPRGAQRPAPPGDPLQALLDRPNPFTTGPELIEATEINMCIWGKAYWGLEIENGHWELWPLRPDRLVPLADKGDKYIRGYIYHGLTGDVAYLPDEVVTFPFFNPLQDRTGLSPIAPLRLTIDMAMAATNYNRRTFQNGGIPDFILFLEGVATQTQRDAFYKTWDERFAGEAKSHRPALLTGGDKMQTLAFSQREMEFNEGLKWAVDETARVLGVPAPMLGKLSDATLANVQSLERIFWRGTMVPQTRRYEARINAELLPKLGITNRRVEFDLGDIDVLTEAEDPRLRRETVYLDRGVISKDEVRTARGLPAIGGDAARYVPLTPVTAPPPTPRTSATHVEPAEPPPNGHRATLDVELQALTLLHGMQDIP